MSRGRIKLAAALGLGLLVATEVFFRVRHHEAFSRFSRDDALFVASEEPGLVYEMRPDHLGTNPRTGRPLATNGHGFRDEAFGEKRPGVVRLAAVGDSVTVGWSVSPQETWARVLEEHLTGAGHEVEVFNFGVSGYDAMQEAALIERRVLEHDPDLVVVGYVLNDDVPWGGGELTRYFRRSGSMVWDRLRMALDRWRHRLGDDLVTVAYERLAGACGEAGVPVVVAIFPELELDEDGGYPHAEEHARVTALCERLGFGVLDLLPVFREAGLERLRTNEDDTTHPDAAGHRLAGLALARYLAEGWEAQGAPGVR